MRNAWALAVVALLPLTSHAVDVVTANEDCSSNVYYKCESSDPVCKYDEASLNEQCSNDPDCVQLKLIDCCPKFNCNPPVEDSTEEPVTSAAPSAGPTAGPSAAPTAGPTAGPSAAPSSSPSSAPNAGPTAGPTEAPSSSDCPSNVYKKCESDHTCCIYDKVSLNKQCSNDPDPECVQRKLEMCCPQFNCEPPPPSPEKVACDKCGDDSKSYNCSAVQKCDNAESKTCSFDEAKVKEHCGHNNQDCIDCTLSTCCSKFGCDAPAGISHQSVYNLYNGDVGGNETFPFGPKAVDSIHDQWRTAIDEIKNSHFPSQTSLKAFDKHCCSKHEQIDPGCKNFDIVEHFQINCMHCPLASVDACNTYWTKNCSMWGDPFISRDNTCRKKINEYCCGDGKDADPACNPEKTDILRRLQLKFYVDACVQLDIETMKQNLTSVLEGEGATMPHQFTTLMLEYASSQSAFLGVSDPQANSRRLLAIDKKKLLTDLGILLLQAFKPGIKTATTTNGLVNWVEVFSPIELAAEPTSIALLLLRITASIGDSKDSNKMRLALLEPLMNEYPEALLRGLSDALSKETFLTSKDVTDVDLLWQGFASANPTLASRIAKKRNANIENFNLDEEPWTEDEVQREFDQAHMDIMMNALASNEEVTSQANNSGSSVEAVHWDGQNELRLESNNVRFEPNICTRDCLVVAKTKDARARDLEDGIQSSVVQIVVIDASSGGGKSGDTGANQISIAFDGLGLGKEKCPKCVHRNEQDPEAAWEDKDCSLVQTKTGAVCKCNHLSEFAIMEDSDSNCNNSIKLLGHEMWYGFFISYAMLGLASFVQAVRAYRNHGARSRGVMQIEHILIFVFSVARLVICASMLQQDPNHSALTFFLALPFPLTVAVFTTMAAAWGSLAAKGGGRGRSEPFLQRRPVFGVLFVVAVFAMTFGLIYSSSSGSNKLGSVDLGVLDAVLRTVIMVCMTLAFLLYGWRLYGSLTKGNMRSKFASAIFMYASLFCILCSAQALLELVQSLERKWYEDHIAWVHGSQLALECSSMVCVMMVFRRAVGQHRGGKMGRKVTIYPGKTFKKIKTISVMPSSRESQIETPPLSVGTIGVGNSADLEAEGINQDHQRHLARASLRFDDSKARQLQMAQNMKGAKKELLKMLKVSDIDGDGRLSCPEFKALLNTSNESYAQKLFAKLDVDGDGSLDRSELRAYMKEKIKREA